MVKTPRKTSTVSFAHGHSVVQHSSSPAVRAAGGADAPNVRVVPFLRRLARRGASARRPRGDRRSEGWQIVFLARSRRSAREAKLPVSAKLASQTGTTAHPAIWSPDLVQQALSAGLVEMRGEELKLSSAGAAFLRRAIAVPEMAYAAQHQAHATRTLDGSTQVTVNECESPLGWLRNRKDRKTGQALISRSQFEAGERLREEFFRAGMTARVTADWSGVRSARRSRRSGVGSSADLNDGVLAAKARFYRALEAVGEELADVLVWVCCDGRGLRDIEREAGWPQRSGKLMLQMALKTLARHYGLEPSRTSPAGFRSNVVHWGAEDYRPVLDGDGED